MTNEQKGVRIVNVNAYICTGRIEYVRKNRKSGRSQEDRMERINREKTGKKERPVRVLQFGEGNFLRAFVDYMVDIANEKGIFDGDIVVVKPIPFGTLERFAEQECQYTVQLRGIVDGEPKRVNRIVTSIADAVDAYSEYKKYAAYAKLDSLRFIVSNTTEAGIVFDASDRLDMEPPKTYPGKLTKLLYERYLHFNGAEDKGLIILPVELIDDNGIHLKECVEKFVRLWKLPDGFAAWLDDACVFASTLVDRIVTGYPREEAEALCEEFGYRDELIVTGEPFALWVIESGRDISRELPLPAAGLPVIFTDNQKPYKQRKVRILNGAHTSFALAAYLCGHDIVLEAMEDKLMLEFIRKTVFDEVIPTLDLPKEELTAFAEEVIVRFHNPYVRHELLSISLNSVSKWRARCLPSFLEYVEREKKLPAHLTFSLAALLAFYTGNEIRENALIGYRRGEAYRVMDDGFVVKFFAEHSGGEIKEYVNGALSNTELFGRDLTEISGAADLVTAYLYDIRSIGMRAALEKNFPAQG